MRMGGRGATGRGAEARPAAGMGAPGALGAHGGAFVVVGALISVEQPAPPPLISTPLLEYLNTANHHHLQTTYPPTHPPTPYQPPVLVLSEQIAFSSHTHTYPLPPTIYCIYM